jgi:hypothetical protein
METDLHDCCINKYKSTHKRTLAYGVSLGQYESFMCSTKLLAILLQRNFNKIPAELLVVPALTALFINMLVFHMDEV